jgi:glycogenin glucosyltransferase
MRLESEFDEVVVVDVLNSNNDAMLTLLKRPELGVTLTKVDFNLTIYHTDSIFVSSFIAGN